MKEQVDTCNSSKEDLAKKDVKASIFTLPKSSVDVAGSRMKESPPVVGANVATAQALTPNMTPQGSVDGGRIRFNPNTNKVDVADHFSLLHSNLSRDDAADILEMANIAISRSQQKKRKSKRNQIQPVTEEEQSSRRGLNAFHSDTSVLQMFNDKNRGSLGHRPKRVELELVATDSLMNVVEPE